MIEILYNLYFDNYFLFRIICGIWFLIDLLSYLPSFFRYFGTQYQPNSFIKNPLISKIVILLWFISCLNLILPGNSLLGAALLSFLFRYFYIYSRSSNLFRGGGAVGMYPTFIINTIFLIELGYIFNFSEIYFTFVILIMFIHLGITIFDAGLYKCLNGYYNGHGIEYALNNHLWTYWAPFFNKYKIHNILWKIANIFISSFQVIIGILLINPFTVILGIKLLSFGFIFLGIFLKLGTLPFLIGSYQILLPDFSLFNNYSFESYINHSTYLYYKLNIFNYNQNLENFLIFIFLFLLFLYFLVQICIYINFYFKYKFNFFIQILIDFLSLYSPILIWRVFSADVVNLLVNVYEINNNEKIRLNSEFFYNKNAKNFFAKFRFFHVAESCVLSSIFNSVKYNENNLISAKQKLIRYTKTLDDQKISLNNPILYEVIILNKNNNKIIETLIEEWIVKKNLVDIKYKNKGKLKLISKFVRPFSSWGRYY
tara:strand:+ start:24929 stop:26380 length:1452 start_codon:yes stop_codon:yes gene_type:complete